MLSKPIPANPELSRLIAKAKGYVMSPAEYAAQRKSWTKGQVMLSNPNMTEERFEEIWASLPENALTNEEQD